MVCAYRKDLIGQPCVTVVEKGKAEIRGIFDDK